MTCAEFEKLEPQVRAAVRIRLMRLGSRGDELDDLEQITILRILNRVETVRNIHHFALRVARNAFADSRRLGYRSKEIGESELCEVKLEEIAGGRNDADLDALFDGPEPEILERYANLSTEYRQAIRLVIEHGSLVAAARASGIPQGTIHSRIWRAKQLLLQNKPKRVPVGRPLAA